MKEAIVIWTPDLPEGYGAFDQWQNEYLDETEQDGEDTDDDYNEKL
jgi:hypothetical protein